MSQDTGLFTCLEVIFCYTTYMTNENEDKSLDKTKGNLNVPASKLPPATVHQHGDFRASFHWRVFRVMSELVDGWQFLADFSDTKTVTFFGSARFQEGYRWYDEARKLGQLLAGIGFGVITGGGPGIMEAGNRGMAEKNGKSIGLNIELQHEQRVNPWVKNGIGFHYFFTRKVMLSYAAQAYIYFPGGFGTLDEFFEIVTLIQTKKIAQHIPVICVGKEYWDPLLNWVDDQVYGKFQAIDKEDEKIYQVVDTAEEAFEIIKNSPERKEF